MVQEPRDIFDVITDGWYSLVVTTLAGALILALAMENIKQQMVREQRRAERARMEFNIYGASLPSNAASEMESFREWQIGRLLLHSSGLNVLTAIVWAHAATQSECLALVASALAFTEILVAASTQVLLLRTGTPLTWHDVRMTVLGVTCAVDLAILLLVVPAAVSPQLHEDPSTCSLPQSAWLTELMRTRGLSVALPTTSMDIEDGVGLRRVISHLPPINFLIGLSYAMTAVDIAGWDPAIVLASLSMQLVESLVILTHPRMQGDADGQLLVFTLVCQWLSFGAALIATATLYAPLTRECYYAQTRKSEMISERQCAVCMEGVAAQAFVPCGHRCCKGCSDRIMSTSRTCPHCRSTATEAIRIF